MIACSGCRCRARPQATVAKADVTHEGAGDGDGPSVWVVRQPVDRPFLRPTYLMDADCGFCQKSMKRVTDRFPDTFVPVAYWDAPLADIGLNMDRCHAQGHFVVPLPDGTVQVMAGGQSWAGVLQQQKGLWRLLGNAMTHQPFAWVAGLVYRLVADNRSTLGGGSCGIDT